MKTKVVLDEGEAYVVLSLDRWNHIITTYRVLGERLDTEEGRQAWLDLADEVEAWVLETQNLQEHGDLEDEWA